MCHELYVRRFIPQTIHIHIYIEPYSSVTTTVHALGLVFATASNCIVFFERRAIDPEVWTSERGRDRYIERGRERSFAFVKCNRKLMVDVMKQQIAAPLLLLLLLAE